MQSREYSYGAVYRFVYVETLFSWIAHLYKSTVLSADVIASNEVEMKIDAQYVGRNLGKYVVRMGGG
jgi:hypothetical protein